MGDPPVAGGTHATVTDAFPEVTVGAAGASGVFGRAMELDAAGVNGAFHLT